MKVDRFTKSVLVVIALALAIIAFNGLHPSVPSAVAAEPGGEERFRHLSFFGGIGGFWLFDPKTGGIWVYENPGEGKPMKIQSLGRMVEPGKPLEVVK